jgi:DNA repair exonuclease SbcCD ATPase subunit
MKRTLVISLTILLLAGCASSPAEKAVAMDMVAEAERTAGFVGIAGRAEQRLHEEQRLVIRTATVYFECSDPEEALEAALERAKDLDGWVQESGKERAKVRVPDEKLEDYLEAIEDLGDVTQREIRGQDITTRYRDTKTRLENLERAHKRYQELLDKAANVTEALAVEKELERVVGEIEVLKGRLKHMQGQVVYATVNLRFREGSTPGPLAWPFVGIYYAVKWLFVWD